MTATAIDTVPYFYASEDFAGRHASSTDVPTWSVYGERYERDMFAEGEPIDGSQHWILSAPDESTARRIVQALYVAETLPVIK